MARTKASVRRAWEASKANAQPSWHTARPHAMKLLDPTHTGEIEFRNPEVDRARANILSSWYLYHPSGQANAFLNLIEAIEKERKETLLHHQALVANLEAQLKSTKAKDVSAGTTQHDPLDQGQIDEVPQNDMQSWGRVVLRGPISPSIVPVSQPTSLTDSPVNSQSTKFDGGADGNMATRAEHKHKDPSKFRFKCDRCEKSFTRSTTLQEHRRSHNDERRWACQHCEKRFVRLKDCKRHESLQHAPKTIECGRSFWLEGEEWQWGCHQRFTRQDGLISHLRAEKGQKCLQPFLADNNCLFFLAYGDEWDHGNKFRCSQASNSCQKEFDELGLFLQHLKALAGKICAIEWIVHHIMNIYRGRSEASLVPPSSENGAEQRRTPITRNEEVPSRAPNHESAERDLHTPMPLENVISLPAEDTNSQAPREFIDDRVFKQPRTADLAEPQGRLRSGAVVDIPVSPGSESSYTAISTSYELVADWVLVSWSNLPTWRLPGAPFWVLIKCTQRLEGEALFYFDKYYVAAAVTLEGPGLSAQGSEERMYRFSCVIPESTLLWFGKEVQVSISPEIEKQKHLGPYLSKHFVVGRILNAAWSPMMSMQSTQVSTSGIVSSCDDLELLEGTMRVEVSFEQEE